MMKNWIKVSVHGFVAVMLDFIFHTFYTLPQETFLYFFFKFLLVGILSYFIQLKKLTYLRIFSFTGLFVLLFGLYYRILEVAFGLNWGGRVPDIMLFGSTITYYNSPLLSVIVWGTVHGLAYLIPVLFIKWWKK